ncbi:hypothetical protein [Methanolobus profundi]|uniref:Uncharacterized protein n=1 Tax=Methanolobus profundi TaxID=487685 RepID=A0A1I4S6P4_9EURY|nr:hypothetical protein [Methanolobus profundi]SFM60167.1 hypothetical protein SAMN04488696_1807 [Methanolobus profundi]
MIDIRRLLKNSFYIYSLGMVGFLLLLGFLVLAYILAIYIAKTVTINQYTLGLLNSSFTLILVVVTAIYVFFTYGILNQTTKSEKRSFIEKRLQKLYYPLLRVTSFSENDVSGEHILIDDSFSTNDKKHNIYELETYLYLARNESSKEISSFLDQLCDEDSFLVSLNEVKNLRSLLIKDIDYYKKELEALVDN